MGEDCSLVPGGSAKQVGAVQTALILLQDLFQQGFRLNHFQRVLMFLYRNMLVAGTFWQSFDTVVFFIGFLNKVIFNLAAQGLNQIGKPILTTYYYKEIPGGLELRGTHFLTTMTMQRHPQARVISWARPLR